MKHVMLIAQGLAADPVEELGRHTPLEVAKTPFMDILAMRGRVGFISFIPSSLTAGADAACLSALGFDPLEHYTGLAPLEAAALGLETTDQEVLFRCDWVTVEGDLLVDVTRGLSATESRGLIQTLNAKFSGENVKFYTNDGAGPLLGIKDPAEAEALDELGCTPPSDAIGQSFTKHLPRGRAGRTIKDLMNACRQTLEASEINRVRIDLKENPANMVWPWGQGRVPKTPGFRQQYGVDGALHSETAFARGLGRVLGLSVMENLTQALETLDFAFVYCPMRASDSPLDLKSRIRWIEEFDSQVVGHVFKVLERFKERRIFISADLHWPLTQTRPAHGHAPFLVTGDGYAAESMTLNEKNASQSRWRLDKGHEFMGPFLK